MARRRHAVYDSDDSDEDCGPGPMSPNTRKQEEQKRIMGEDLGQATVDHITTSDYASRRAPKIRIIPKSDFQGTEEARIASQNAAETNSWRTWGDSDEAKTTSAGVEPLAGGAEGNSHRYRSQQERMNRERELGREVDLKDTYDDRPPRTGASHSHRPPMRARNFPLTNSISFSGSGPKIASKKLIRGRQDRPWPPPFLEAPSAFPANAGANLTTAALQAVTSSTTPLPKQKSSTVTNVSVSGSIKNVQAGLSKGQPLRHTSKIATSRESRVGNVSSRHPYDGPLSSDSSAILSSATKYFASIPNAQQAQKDTNISSTVAEQKPSPGAKDTSQQPPSPALQNDNVRKIPVSEFAFPINAALAPPDVSTHTDGAPSPTALSGFSMSAGSHAPPSVQSSIQTDQAWGSNATTGDLIGLGIQEGSDGSTQQLPSGSSSNPNITDLASHNGSIMDSPILDNMSNDVLVAGKGKVVIINGIRYVPESELLTLKQSLTSTGTKHDTTASHVPLSKDVISATTVLSPHSQNQESPTPDLPPSSNVSHIATKANPFNPRESTVDDEAKIPILPSPMETTNENQKQMDPLTLDEALVAALRSDFNVSSFLPISTLTPIETAMPLSPASTISTKPQTRMSATIISKWAPAVAYPGSSVPMVTPPVSSVLSGERKNNLALQPKSTNGGGVHASSTRGGKNEPLPNPSGTLLPSAHTLSQLSTSPIIGDRRAFGHLSSVATAPLNHASAPARPAPKRKFDQPGPGYTMLLADLQRSSTHSTTQAGASASGLLIPREQPVAEDSEESEL